MTRYQLLPEWIRIRIAQPRADRYDGLVFSMVVTEPIRAGSEISIVDGELRIARRWWQEENE